jgi:cytochrome c553
MILDIRIVSLGLALLGVAAAPVHASPERVDELIRTALELDPDVERGAKLYQVNCSNCHGPKAFGDAKQLIPALAGQRRAYLIKQLADFAELERVATQMHRVVAQAEVSEPQEWADITAYINGLPPLTAQQHGDGKDIALGEASYEQWCASCHGADGRGDDDGFAPSLRNQHFAYLLHQMRELAVGHRSNVEPELVLFLDSLDAEEMRGLADYMSRMKGPTIDRSEMRHDGFVGD